MQEIISVTLAEEFFEVYLNSRGEDTFINFYLPFDEEGEVIGRYINAIDLMNALGYKNIVSSWNRLKRKYNFGIECSFTITEGNEVVGVEDFLSFLQAAIIIKESSKIGAGEKVRLVQFLVKSIKY